MGINRNNCNKLQHCNGDDDKALRPWAGKCDDRVPTATYTPTQIETYLAIPASRVRGAFFACEIDHAAWPETRPPAFLGRTILAWIDKESVKYKVTPAGRVLVENRTRVG